MQTQDEQIATIANAIERYLDSHPDAADTAEGIARWWLSPEYSVDTVTVRSALALLEARGQIRRRINADQHELFLH